MARMSIALVSGVGMAMGLVSAQTAAAQGLEEIIVTAQKRGETVISIPVAIQSISGEELDRKGIAGLDTLTQAAPGFQLAVAGSTAVLTMRGISGEIAQIAGEPSVVVSSDGVPFARQLYFQGAFFDVERIEVLRGPQGTLNGRNSTAGAVNIINKRPTADFHAGIDVTFGNYDRISTEAYISGPLSGDKLLGRLFFKTNDNDVYLRNVSGVPNAFPGEGNNNERMGRASLTFLPTDDFEATLSAEGYYNKNYGPMNYYNGMQIPGGMVVLPPGLSVGPETDIKDMTFKSSSDYNYWDMEIFAATLNMKWNLGPQTTLASVTGYREFDTDTEFDLSAHSIPFLKQDVFAKGHQVSQELTLASAIGKNFDWIIGGLYIKDDAYHFIPSHFLHPAFGGLEYGGEDDQFTESWSAYAQARWRFIPDWELTVGGRYTRDRKFVTEFRKLADPALEAALQLAGIPAFVSGRQTYSAFTPRVAIDWKPNNDLTLFVSAQRGFKAGGINSSDVTISGVGFNSYDPELVWDYEAGIKSRWFDRRLGINLTVFRANIKDLQVPQYILGGTRIMNAAKSTNQGVELEVSANPVDGLNMSFNATYLDAEFDEFCGLNTGRPDLQPAVVPPGCPPGAAVGNTNLAGGRLQRAPKLAFNAGASYRFGLGSIGSLTVGGDYAYQSKVYFTVFEEENMAQRSYGLLNLHMTYETSDGRISVTAFGRNITDKRYFTNMTSVAANYGQIDGNGNPWIPGVTASAATNLAVVGVPRTYGVRLGYHF